MRIICSWDDYLLFELCDICSAVVNIKTGKVWYHLLAGIFIGNGYADFPAKYNKQGLDKAKALIRKTEKIREPIYKINAEYKRKFGYSADLLVTCEATTPEEVTEVVTAIQERIDKGQPFRDRPTETIENLIKNGLIYHNPPKLTWSFAEFEDLYKGAKQ